MKKQSVLFFMLFSAVIAINAMKEEKEKMWTEVNSGDLLQMVSSLLNAEGCGICKQRGADWTFVSPYSRGAHKGCFNLIQPALVDVSAYLKTLIVEEGHGQFNYGPLNRTNTEIVRLVQAKIGEAATLKSYFEENGSDKLKQLFNQALMEVQTKGFPK